ncbi:hypothetical protein ONE63_000380 [Megalurothrips usitatus]|uniref:Threonine aspartase 1 n=1 Tax=Megalurothrips usitatus TaxID=439358 RepID=A0AAV7Y252_9NEOP|nr:hypothetical protein ONE63_000380 [Megalurothrips usitatus]
MTGFIGVHAGAGDYGDDASSAYKKLCRDACRKGIEVLKAGGSALEAVAASIVIFEECPLTNAGYGSNLTWDGTVECDACVMDGESLTWGGVGAVSGVRNPIVVAKNLCIRQTDSELLMGRVPPSLLVGEGARKWAEETGIPTVDPKSLISERSKKVYNHYKRKLAKAQKKSVEFLSPLDTVGAVCIDSKGHVAAASSSGGIILKHSGRVGQAAMFGCGCWAQDGKDGKHSVATSTSGCGEYLARTLLAREAGNDLMSSGCGSTCLYGTMVHKFLESPFLTGVPEKLGGVLALKYEDGGVGEFLWAHTTTSFCIGYMSCDDTNPRSRMSRLPRGTVPGTKVVVEGVGFKLDHERLTSQERSPPPSEPDPDVDRDACLRARILIND